VTGVSPVSFQKYAPQAPVTRVLSSVPVQMEDLLIGLLVVALAASAVLLAMQAIAHKRLRRETRDRNMMIALLSHRLRSPLSSIKWHVEMLLDSGFGKLQIAQLELLNQVNHSIGDAIGVLNTFLEASRIEQAKATSAPMSIDVWQAVDTTIANLQHSAKTAHKIVRTGAGKRVTVLMDKFAFLMILEVLLHNAFVYTPQDGTVTVAVREKGATVEISVADTGVGIPPEERAQVFEKFFRGKRAKELDTNGNGLGLYLAKEILEQVGGSIVCDSAPGRGTIFTITLPNAKTA
jgi:signal transduction histidine kinase